MLNKDNSLALSVKLGEFLDGYLFAYYQAARAQLDERGQPVVDWLARVLEGKPEQEGKGV